MANAKWLGIFVLMLAVAGCNLDTWTRFIEDPCAPTFVPAKGPTVIDITDVPYTDMEGFYKHRPLYFLLTADYPEGEIEADEILVDGKVHKPGDLTKIGPHSLIIHKKGYESIDTTFDVPRGLLSDDYIESRTLACKDRQIVLQLYDKVTGAKVEPDQVLIGAQEIHDGDMVRPGRAPLEIKKRGYYNIVEDNFAVPPGEGSYILKGEMVSGKVELHFAFVDAKTKNPIEADTITLNDRATSDGSFVDPGPYQLHVGKQGYQDLNTRVDVPQTPSYVIRQELIPATIRLYWEIWPDTPKDMEEIDPIKLVLLDGREIDEGTTVGAGKHELEFREPGFEPLLTRITVPADRNTYEYKGEMVSLPRLVSVNVTYDIVYQNMPSPQVTIRNLETHATYQKSGQKLKPGKYEITVEQPAYRTARTEKIILPASFPEEVEVKLLAKDRVVQATVTFDVQPPQDLPPHVINFVDEKSTYRRAVKPGGAIRPGVYLWEVEKPGYKMEGGRQKAAIEPGEAEYSIKANMIAQPRQFVFSMVNEQGVLVEAQELKVDGQPYSYESRYRPRPEVYRIEATFRDYHKVVKDVVLPPGEGPYKIALDLRRK